MTEQKGDGGTIVRRVVLRQGGEPVAAEAPQKMQMLPSEDSVQGLFETAATAQQWAAAGTFGPVLPFRGSTGGQDATDYLDAQHLPLEICKGRFTSVQHEPLQRAAGVMREGTASRPPGETTHEERRQGNQVLRLALPQRGALLPPNALVAATNSAAALQPLFLSFPMQALRSDAQVQCGAPNADGKRPHVPPNSCSLGPSHRPPSPRVESRTDGDYPASVVCNTSNHVSKRLISSSRPPASRGEREEIRRAQQELLRSPPVQQVLQQAQKGIHRLFEAFASDGVINHKGWGRFALFANLAPCPEMLRFFKQVVGSTMDETAFEAALFQLTFALYGIDAKQAVAVPFGLLVPLQNAREDKMSRCFANLLSHCLVDDVRALRDGQGLTRSLAHYPAECLSPLMMISTGVVELNFNHEGSCLRKGISTRCTYKLASGLMRPGFSRRLS
ncbi:hypothetical protein Emed_005758 [Eimeria media]